MQKQASIILVGIQLPENLGFIARIMHNFNLQNLRVVNPTFNIHNSKSFATATSGNFILENAQIFNSLEDAIKDCHFVIGTTCNTRDMVKIYETTPSFFKKLNIPQNQHIAFVFGSEKSGLSNEHIVLCNQVLSIPTNFNGPSMNISHAVAIIAYEYSIHKTTCSTKKHPKEKDSPPATQNDINIFLNFLEKYLDRSNYWRVPSKKKKMWQNMRNIFKRCQLTKQETKSLIGAIYSIAKNTQNH